MTTPAAQSPVQAGRMTQGDIVKALIGMLLAMMTAFLSSTIVSTALPTIITSLHGTQDQYTWVVTATLLASTSSTPIWGKLADLVNKKILVQVAIFIFTLGSIAAGFAQSVDTLIVWRGLQGLGLGGLQALIVIVIAAMVSPRERGKYMGPIAAVMSVATVAGPLLGGFIVDSSLGWRWCFFAGAPLAVIALVVVQRTLNIPTIKREVHIDYAGAILLTSGVSTLLIWITLAGNNFEWLSVTSFAMAGVGVALIAALLVVETKVREPIIPLRMFTDRTTTLATVASIGVGTAMFGGAVFLGQYFQIARGYSPTAAGLLMLPMIIGSMLSSTGTGLLITKFGRWKVFLVVGSIIMTGGFGLLSTIGSDTNIVAVGAYLFLLGTGMGALTQNLVLAVQNSSRANDIGASSSIVSFFRSLGGTIGVSVLGSILSARVADHIADGLAKLGIDASQTAGDGGSVGLSTLNDLPAPIVDIVRDAYGDGTGAIFLVSLGMSVLAVICVLCIKEVRLNTKNSVEQQRAEAEATNAADDPPRDVEHEPAAI